MKLGLGMCCVPQGLFQSLNLSCIYIVFVVVVIGPYKRRFDYKSILQMVQRLS